MMFTKDPDATLDYMIDWSRWLANDIIETSEWIVPAALTVVREAQTETACTIWLAGGEAGHMYAVTNRITTNGGRVEDRTFTIRCQER